MRDMIGMKDRDGIPRNLYDGLYDVAPVPYLYGIEVYCGNCGCRWDYEFERQDTKIVCGEFRVIRYDSKKANVGVFCPFCRAHRRLVIVNALRDWWGMGLLSRSMFNDSMILMEIGPRES